MKFLILYVLIAFTIQTKAQSPFEQIIKAELDFEKTCRDSGIKKGFLANMDTTAIAFTKEGIVNARKFWLGLPEAIGILSWAPSFAEVSLDGNWGFTTGAVEYRDSSINDTPSAYNQYTTVWQKNKSGQWKYLVDIGNPHGPVAIDSVTREIKIAKTPVKKLDKLVIINKEKEFATLLKVNPDEALMKYYSKNFVLNFSGNAATTTLDKAVEYYLPVASNLKFEPLDFRISSLGDMVVVSGKLTNLNTRNFYVRIWRHEPTGWKIALEVIKI